MKLWTQPLGPLQMNGYVLSNEKGEGIIIDPGQDPQAILDYIRPLKIVAILLTHAHFDHIGGLEEVRQVTQAPVYIHDLEADWLLDPELKVPPAGRCLNRSNVVPAITAYRMVRF